MTNELVMAVDAEIDGRWLRDAIDEQGDTLRDCAKKLGLSYPTTVYNHANNVSYMGAKLLAGLATIYPTINLHYILTGVGKARLDSVDAPTVYISTSGAVNIKIEE